MPGPLDIVGRAGLAPGRRRIGAVDDDLAAAMRLALTADRAACAAVGRSYSWDACTDQFASGLAVRERIARAA